MAEVKLAIGLMSGTSRDGIDAALIETDGRDYVRSISFLNQPYDEDVRNRLAEACQIAVTMAHPDSHPAIDLSQDEITRLHIESVRDLLKQAGVSACDVYVIGFHGHTIAHRPESGWTWQIGDGALMAQELEIVVINDLRNADVAAGGQGAPLLPVYHRALAAKLDKPVAILNLGGVANITFIGENGELVAFDTGMASAMIDDWMQQVAGVSFDEGGMLAASGTVDHEIISRLLAHPYFSAKPPKSLERAEFTLAPLQNLSPADGAATLTAFSAKAVGLALRFLPANPRHIYATGGGRHNVTMMRMIADAVGVPLSSVDELGWDGDAMEAQGFAYMAVRALKGLPISFPGTTGAPTPLTGGTLHVPWSSHTI
jgi:anhydro-N-acetylmuramic acid kinase